MCRRGEEGEGKSPVLNGAGSYCSNIGADGNLRLLTQSSEQAKMVSF
jgi:hypothetical protein